MDCPKCVGKLQKTVIREDVTSEIPELAGAGVSFELPVSQCFVCGGVWFDKGELDKYLTEHMTILESPTLGEGLDKELDLKKANCPRCHLVMKKVAAPKAPNVKIDVCEKCQGVWLDAAEINRLESANKPKLGFLTLFFKGFRRA